MPQRLLSLLARLRHPVNGCPWDREQTPYSLCVGILDEAFELVEAIEHASATEVAEELGDLLFQLMFVVYLYSERHKFTLDDVINGISDKMIRRHPHVFGEKRADSAKQVLATWEQIKLGEKKDIHPLDSVPKALPALAQARRLWHKAMRLNWLDEKPADEKELMALMRQTLQSKDPEFFGRLLFQLVLWGAAHNMDAEELLRAANYNFKTKIRALHPVG